MNGVMLVSKRMVLKGCGPFSEKFTGRNIVHTQLIHTVRSHYEDLDVIAQDIERLGYINAAKILKEKLPNEKTSRSGEIGEILATEIVEEAGTYKVYVRRLRYKDGRNMALRGDDVIGIMNHEKVLKLLKGEAKSGVSITQTVIKKARESLNTNEGRPNPLSLIFISDRLMESDDMQKNELGRKLRDEVAQKTIPESSIEHALFIISGNKPVNELSNDLKSASINHPHWTICLHIIDHQSFIEEIYKEAEKLGID